MATRKIPEERQREKIEEALKSLCGALDGLADKLSEERLMEVLSVIGAATGAVKQIQIEDDEQTAKAFAEMQRLVEMQRLDEMRLAAARDEDVFGEPPALSWWTDQDTRDDLFLAELSREPTDEEKLAAAREKMQRLAEMKRLAAAREEMQRAHDEAARARLSPHKPVRHREKPREQHRVQFAEPPPPPPEAAAGPAVVRAYLTEVDLVLMTDENLYTFWHDYNDDCERGVHKTIRPGTAEYDRARVENEMIRRGLAVPEH